MKRILSLSLVLFLLLGLFSGMKLTAKAAQASYNSGKRGEICTSLSAAGQKYYTGSYTYDQLSALQGESLRTRLRALITSNRKTVGYDGLKEYMAYTDAYQGSSSKLTLFYCNGTTTSEWDRAATWNREHMWPDSKGGNAVEGDLHSMRPTDPHINSTRGNNPYGEVNGGKEAVANEKNGGLVGGHYAGSVFEPLDLAKGDCARTVLYDYVVSNKMSSVGIVFTDVDTLLNWCKLDPVDTYEMSRNDVVQEIQGCRNPFVDYPELAWLIMGKDIAPEYNITVSSNNNAYGTVSLQGKTITATPAAGYYAESYTVLSGTATVSRDGDLFIVNPKSDCSIRINFAKKSTVTVGFRGAAETMTAYAGEAITLPSSQDVKPYEFVGWVENPVAKTTVRPAYRSAGSSYVPSANIDFYALYRITEGGTGGSGKWNLVEDSKSLTNGVQLVIASNQKGKLAGDIPATYMSPVDGSFSSDLRTIEELPEKAVILTLGGSEGQWTLTDQQGRQLGSSNKKVLGWGVGTLTWDIQIKTEGASIANTISTYGQILYNAQSPRFTTYTGSTSTSMLLPQLYMLDGTAGTTYYTTEIGSCKHETVTFHQAVEASCTEDGSIAYYCCDTCGLYFADEGCNKTLSASQLVVEATGHDYDSSVTAPTCTERGFTTYTCKVCEDSYVDDPVEALGHRWDEGVVTLEPTETEDGLKTYTCTQCGETKEEVIYASGQEPPVCENGEDCGANTFTDMPGVSDWAHAGIDFALAQGLFNGMNETTFAPEKSMTRSMLVTVLWRYAGEPEEGEILFTDVAEDAWYAKAVAWASYNEIVNGMGDGTFRPDNKITREQLATILFRFAEKWGYEVEERAELDSFPDVEQIQSYAVEPLQWATAVGLINGVSVEGTAYLRPAGDATRAQVATILMRFVQSIATEE